MSGFFGMDMTPRPDVASVSELRWKDESTYLTIEGYPLGTTCWVATVHISGKGRRTICALSPLDVYRKVCEFIADPLAYRGRRGPSELPLEGEEGYLP